MLNLRTALASWKSLDEGVEAAHREGAPVQDEVHTPMTTDYRTALTNLLGECLDLGDALLADADFDSSPQLFGPAPQEFVRSRAALLLRKAQIHMAAVLRASEANNLHSLAVHMRVVLECCARVESETQALLRDRERGQQGTFTGSEHARFADAEVREVLLKLTRGGASDEDIHVMITGARRSVGDEGTDMPKPSTLSALLDVLPGGRSWYAHLADGFCHPAMSALRHEQPFFGSVETVDPVASERASMACLDYLTDRAIGLLAGLSVYWVVIASDERPLDEVAALHERKESMRASFLGNVT